MTIELQKEAIPLEVRRHKLVATVRYQLDDNVLVGVSGGADSVALLLLCCSVGCLPAPHPLRRPRLTWGVLRAGAPLGWGASGLPLRNRGRSGRFSAWRPHS